MKQVVSLSILVFLAATLARAEERKWPAGTEGFSGQVRGVVTKKTERMFEFKVGKVIRTWEDNKAEKPEALVGQTILVGPRWEEGEEGWHAVELHAKFIAKLEKDEEITLEVRTSERGRFAILELSEEQRKRARGHVVLPDGVAGFVGRVRGVVVEKLDDHVVRFRIEKVTRVWKGNEATNIEAMEKLLVRIGPRWTKGDDGKWHQDARHVRFVKTLEKDEKLDLEVRQGEHDYFPILELSKEQRKRAEPR